VVESGDKGRGYEIGKNEFLPVEDEELESLALKARTPSTSRSSCSVRAMAKSVVEHLKLCGWKFQMSPIRVRHGTGKGVGKEL